jgi:hypothetical protein
MNRKTQSEALRKTHNETPRKTMPANTSRFPLAALAGFMRRRSRRTMTVLVALCCLAVVVSATAHLLHSINPAPRHGKDIADIYSKCAFSIGTAQPLGYVAPAFTVMRLSRRDYGSPPLYSSGLLRVQIGRAPPA